MVAETTSPHIFHNLQFVLDLGSLPYKKKKILRDQIISHGGSYILTKKSNFVIVPCEKGSKIDTYKTRKAQQLNVPVVTRSFVEDCIDNSILLDADGYKVAGLTRSEVFSKGKVEVKSWKQLTSSHSKRQTFADVTKLLSSKFDSFSKDCPCYLDDFQIGKFAILYNDYKDGLQLCVLELHLPLKQCSSDVDKNAAKFRVQHQSVNIKSKNKATNFKSVEYHLSSCSYALAVMRHLVEENEKSEMKHLSILPRLADVDLGSHKLRQMFDDMGAVTGNPNPNTSLVVRAMMQSLTQATEGIQQKDFTTEQVTKAVAILENLSECLDNGKSTFDLTQQFYSTIPMEKQDPITDKRSLMQKVDLVQLLKDGLLFNELDMHSISNDFNDKDKPTESRFSSDLYKFLRCSLTWLQPNDADYKMVKSLIEKSVLDDESQKFKIINIYRLYRDAEFADFTHSIGNRKLLFHSSKPENFLGILSRGLLPPLVLVDEHGLDRSDCGLLGSGIYFADDFRTSVAYSQLSPVTGSRLLLVNEVCLGKCHNYTQPQYGLTEPPSGYQSICGVGKHVDARSAFNANEFVIFNKHQQRLRYLVEFTVEFDPSVTSINVPKTLHQEQLIADLIKQHTVKTAKHVQLKDVEKTERDAKEIKPGLFITDTSGETQAKLQKVHVRGKILDLVAEVVIFQEYVNNALSEVEAKYVFPLDDSAAVCGFEAFINNKHIIGQVKEKETAHREYKEAISKGHGAYLMDEETPEVFTVSVGNLPPRARVVIKITYVTELPVMINESDLTDYIQFHLPNTVAPSVKDNILASGPVTQTKTDRVQTTTAKLKQKYCCTEPIPILGIPKMVMCHCSINKSTEKYTKTDFSLQLSVEMPHEIKTLECSTNRIMHKRTKTKAVVRLAKGDKIGDEGFRLLIGLAEIHVPRMWVERHPEAPSQACMLAFYPEFDVEAVKDYRAIIMLDMSNSMADSDTQLTESHTKLLALLILKSLPKDCLVNFVRFGSSYEELFVTEQPLKEKGVATKAEEFIQESTADRGVSDAWRPLASENILKEFHEKSRLTNIFLISDGHLTEENKLLQLATSLRHVSKAGQDLFTTRIFTFSVGSTSNQHLMKSIAHASTGFHQHFTPTLKSKWHQKIKNQLSKASQPVLTDIQIKWGKYNDKDDHAEMETSVLPVQAPEHISTLYNSSRLVVYGMVPHCSQATLSAKVCGQEISTVVSTSELSITTGKTIHRLAARAVIRDYETGMHEVNPLKRDELKKLRRPCIISLSIAQSIISQYTSFVAIEKRDKDKAADVLISSLLDKLIQDSSVDILIEQGWDGQLASDKVSFESIKEQIQLAEIMYFTSVNQFEHMLQTALRCCFELTDEDRCKARLLLSATEFSLGIRVNRLGRRMKQLFLRHNICKDVFDNDIAETWSMVLAPGGKAAMPKTDAEKRKLKLGLEKLMSHQKVSFQKVKEHLSCFPRESWIDALCLLAEDRISELFAQPLTDIRLHRWEVEYEMPLRRTPCESACLSHRRRSRFSLACMAYKDRSAPVKPHLQDDKTSSMGLSLGSVAAQKVDVLEDAKKSTESSTREKKAGEPKLYVELLLESQSDVQHIEKSSEELQEKRTAFHQEVSPPAPASVSVLPDRRPAVPVEQKSIKMSMDSTMTSPVQDDVAGDLLIKLDKVGANFLGRKKKKTLTDTPEVVEESLGQPTLKPVFFTDIAPNAACNSAVAADKLAASTIVEEDISSAKPTAKTSTVQEDNRECLFSRATGRAASKPKSSGDFHGPQVSFGYSEVLPGPSDFRQNGGFGSNQPTSSVFETSSKTRGPPFVSALSTASVYGSGSQTEGLSFGSGPAAAAFGQTPEAPKNAAFGSLFGSTESKNIRHRFATSTAQSDNVDPAGGFSFGSGHSVDSLGRQHTRRACFPERAECAESSYWSKSIPIVRTPTSPAYVPTSPGGAELVDSYWCKDVQVVLGSASPTYVPTSPDVAEKERSAKMQSLQRAEMMEFLLKDSTQCLVGEVVDKITAWARHKKVPRKSMQVPDILILQNLALFKELTTAGVMSLGVQVAFIAYRMLWMSFVIHVIKELIASGVEQKNQTTLESCMARLNEALQLCEKIHPGIYRRLELGLSWDEAVIRIKEKLDNPLFHIRQTKSLIG